MAAVALAEALSSNVTLQRIFLNGNEITDVGAVAVAHACVGGHPSLVRLGLAHNAIGGVGAHAVATGAEAAAATPTLPLERICLFGNPFMDAAAAQFCDAALRRLGPLQNVHLKDHGGDGGAAAAAPTLAAGPDGP